MQVFEKGEVKKPAANRSINQTSKHFFSPTLNLSQKKKKKRRSTVSKNEIENLILSLPAIEKSVVLKKILEASLTNKTKPRITTKNVLIMQLVSQGYTYKEISVMMFLSPRTVENKVYKLTKEFNCRNKTHLAVKLMRACVIE